MFLVVRNYSWVNEEHENSHDFAKDNDSINGTPHK